MTKILLCRSSHKEAALMSAAVSEHCQIKCILKSSRLCVFATSNYQFQAFYGSLFNANILVSFFFITQLLLF